jgi:dienelactone hydrolase
VKEEVFVMGKGMYVMVFALVAVCLTFTAQAFGAEKSDIREMYLEYEHEGTMLEAFVAWDEALDGKRPGVIVVHEWNGINEQILRRCRMLAELGYVGFAADIYGKDVRPKTPEESARQAGIYRSDRTLMRGRINAALSKIRTLPQVDPARIVTMGYCFGGGVALEHARSGADILGAVSFHGNLDTPNPSDAKNIKGKILVLHGAADPHVPMEQVLAFKEEMDEAGVDWQLYMYGHAVHSFTNPDAGNDPSAGAAYDEKADRRSWGALLMFFEEIFKKES